MNFAFPQFLWALGALSIPIIIHLFNFRRTTRIYFSNNRLLRQIKEETTQKRRLKQYLVLLSRLLFIFFLVIAFAQPFIPAKEQVTAARNIILYLDNSLSMSAQVADKTRALDAASSFVTELANVFPADTRYRLLTNDFAPFSNSFKTKSEILDLLAQVRLSPITRSAGEIIKRVQADHSGADIFWISDFQESTLQLDEPLTMDTSAAWHLVPMSLRPTSNVYVDSVYLDNPFIIKGEKNKVNVRLRNSGTKRTEGLIVKLVINDIQNGTVSVNLEPNSFVEANFDITSGLSGLNRATVSFSDFPVSFDNEFFFTLNFTETIKVVEVKADANPTYVERVYGNRQLFTYRGFQASNIDYGVLDQADLVVINGLNHVDPALTSWLNSPRASVGAILLIPGTDPDLTSYSGLLPTSLKWREGKIQQELDRPEDTNPFFENVFEANSGVMAMPHATKQLDWGPDRAALLKFKDGQPFLSQQGNYFVMACALDKQVTDFYTHALFVPVMYRMAAASKHNAQPPYYSLTRGLVTLRVDSLAGEEPLRLEGSQEIVPSQRRVGDNVFLELPKFSMSSGFYAVLNQSDTLGLLAFDLDKEESELKQYRPEDLSILFGEGKHVSLFEAGSGDTFSSEIKARYLGTPLWKQALILALIFLLAEVLLIRFMK